MLSFPETAIVAFERNGGPTLCRVCAAKELGEATVARFERGLSAGVSSEWRCVTLYEANERAVEDGYQNAEQERDEGYEVIDTPNGLFAEGAAMALCEGCGERLDDVPERRGEGLVYRTPAYNQTGPG